MTTATYKRNSFRKIRFHHSTEAQQQGAGMTTGSWELISSNVSSRQRNWTEIDVRLPIPFLSNVFPPTRFHLPKVSECSPNSTSKWGTSIQISEHLRNIYHSNYYTHQHPISNKCIHCFIFLDSIDPHQYPLSYSYSSSIPYK